MLFVSNEVSSIDKPKAKMMANLDIVRVVILKLSKSRLIEITWFVRSRIVYQLIC